MKSFISARQILQEKIHRNIPVSATMDYRILSLSLSTIKVEAALAPNVNIHSTAFAGSIYSIGVLSAWALVQNLIDENGMQAELVIANAEIRYSKPVQGNIRCVCTLKNKQQQEFMSNLKKRKKARIVADVYVGEAPDASLHIILFATLR